MSKVKQDLESYELAKFFDGSLKVGGSYLVSSLTGNVFKGVYMGVVYHFLHFLVDDENDAFIEPNNVLFIREEEV
jgi:hypothetical protein